MCIAHDEEWIVYVWRSVHTTNSSSVNAFSPRTCQNQQLTEWLFALSTQFVAQVGRPSSTDPLLLLDFTVVLGIYTYSLVYRSVYIFIPLLVGLVL